MSFNILFEEIKWIIIRNRLKNIKLLIFDVDAGREHQQDQ